MIVEADIDDVPFEEPPLFRRVWIGDGSHPVFVTDVGATGDIITTSLPLVVSDPSLVPTSISDPVPVLVEGHFDDPAAAECRRPASVADWPDMTDAKAIESCRSRFVVTSLGPFGIGALTVNGVARVVATDGLRVRSSPGTSSESARLEPLLPADARLRVLEGPVTADGYAWYRVTSCGGQPAYPAGWVAVASRLGERWVEAAPGVECPSP